MLEYVGNNINRLFGIPMFSQYPNALYPDENSYQDSSYVPQVPTIFSQVGLCLQHKKIKHKPKQGIGGVSIVYKQSWVGPCKAISDVQLYSTSTYRSYGRLALQFKTNALQYLKCKNTVRFILIFSPL